METIVKRNYAVEIDNRVAFIKKCLTDAKATGVVFGNSGGKDSALVGILCKLACENVLGVIMPCQSKRNYLEDADDGKALAEQFGIENISIDLSDAKQEITNKLEPYLPASASAQAALSNIAPRLRMTTLYALAQTRNALVAGTGNLSERTMGYFTKWGDGACDFNPIADLTATEVFEFLRYLKAPTSIIEKAPSAGLYDGQTDEKDMGLTYAELDGYIKTGQGSDEGIKKIKHAYSITEHKRRMPLLFNDKD